MTNTLITVAVKGFTNPKLRVVHDEK